MTVPLLARVKRRLGPLLDIPQVNALRGVPMPQFTGEAAQRRIAQLIGEGGRLIARVGESEGYIISHHLRRRWGARNPEPYDPEFGPQLKFLTGYFPCDTAGLDRLADIHRIAIQEIDFYAAWTPHDRVLLPRGAETCRLVDLEPFFTVERWTLALAGQRVAVVSPLKDSIERQYARRDALFDRPTLPEFDLVAIRAIQTSCDADIDGQDWLANLDALDAQIIASGASVVIIGAGAYGLPLGARARARGQVALVTGGATQLLFGIMGNRWIDNPAYRALMNPAWIRPAEYERPPGFDRLEVPGGAHW